ncbi:MAG TPA: hypothetical protein VGI21_26030 [Streptosporangiaceae bacterium]
MTTLRIAQAEPQPGRLPHGGFRTRGQLVILADDGGHRAVLIWNIGAGDLANLLAFGVFLAGPGRIERCEAELTRIG